MMKRFLLLALTTVLALGLAATAYAVTTAVGDARAAAAGTALTISGKVTAADGNDYTISDGTDDIKVGFGPAWYKAVQLAVGDSVTITGEVDKGKDGAKAAEIDGFSATKADGTVITVRSGPGRPPWAGRGGPKGAAGQAPEDDD